jgi:hypothetical protein
MLPALRENSPSFKYLQEHNSTFWWMVACPWHGLTTTLQLHSSTMLGACLLQSHGAIYSQSRAAGEAMTLSPRDTGTCKLAYH